MLLLIIISDCLNDFIATIETFLEKIGKSGQYDNVRQACVVLMGGLAKHLDPKDSRVKSIFGTLIDTLSTPSEKVRVNISNNRNCFADFVDTNLKSLLAVLGTRVRGELLACPGSCCKCRIINDTEAASGEANGSRKLRRTV
jgi:hypothetical protein